MPPIEVRPAIATDIPYLSQLDHSYTTEFVWQMDLEVDSDQIKVHFRKTRLPRSVRHEYPVDPGVLMEEWSQRSGLLVGAHDGTPVGYISLSLGVIPGIALATDLAVMRRMRRQGVATALLLAAQEWAGQHACRMVQLVMQSKNYPALSMAQKMGYDFCGYSDRYYPNQDIALFFARALR